MAWTAKQRALQRYLARPNGERDRSRIAAELGVTPELLARWEEKKGFWAEVNRPALEVAIPPPRSDAAMCPFSLPPCHRAKHECILFTSHVALSYRDSHLERCSVLGMRVESRTRSIIGGKTAIEGIKSTLAGRQPSGPAQPTWPARYWEFCPEFESGNNSVHFCVYI
jgi:hypothetical protein